MNTSLLTSRWQSLPESAIRQLQAAKLRSYLRDVVLPFSPRYREMYLKRVPLARPGTPEDATAAVLFLIRDAHYCTGQIIKLDGGRLLT